MTFVEERELVIACRGGGTVFHYVRSGDENTYVVWQNTDSHSNVYVTVDGNVMVFGARVANKAYVFVRSSPTENWTEVTTITAPDGEKQFGRVALSQGRLLVGTHKNVYAYTFFRL